MFFVEGPILPLELSGLVQIGSREYAGQVPEHKAGEADEVLRKDRTRCAQRP